MSSAQTVAQPPGKKQQGNDEKKNTSCVRARMAELRHSLTAFLLLLEMLIDLTRIDLQNTYFNYKNTLQQIAQKIGDIEQEAEEHKLVLETLEPLSEERKCFRLINGVLVERTVKDVVPTLRTNQDGLKKVLDDLVKQYKLKQEELDNWKKKNNVQVVQQ
ncbi:hypothetical protein E4U24_005337 [Claviceps purpurea]|nr:hypothetical protein E4U24_005337 [Claviceps purpurea]